MNNRKPVSKTEVIDDKNRIYKFPDYAPMSKAKMKEVYLATLDDAHSIAWDNLHYAFEADLKLTRALRSKIHKLECQITRVSDAIADAADRQYGKTKWRRSYLLLARVCRKMCKATLPLEIKKELLQQKVDVLIGPYNTQLNALIKEYKRARATCCETNKTNKTK